MFSYNHTLDGVGNRTQVTGANPTQTYQYDALYRLRQAAYSGGPTDIYTYDANGNRLTKNTTNYTYNAADELTQVGSLAYGYGSDGNNGNLATRGSDTFTFNYANQLTQAVIGGVTSTSVYNGDGLRMKHIVDVTGTPVTANYVWDVNRSVPEILQDGTNTYVYGLGRISSTDGSGNQTYYTGDGLGSTTDLTNSSATKTDSYTYDAFGTPTHTSGTSGNAFQFTGQQTDPDSGLQYLRARYYDPSTGRFLGKDPVSGQLGQPGAQNRYVYSMDNPTSQTDPLGLCSSSCEGIASSPTRAVLPAAIGPTSNHIEDLSLETILDRMGDYWACINFGLVIAAELAAAPELAGAIAVISLEGDLILQDYKGAAIDTGFGVGGPAATFEAKTAWQRFGLRYMSFEESGVPTVLSDSFFGFALGFTGSGCARSILGLLV
jgi:RHS repeat-associated protein